MSDTLSHIGEPAPLIEGDPIAYSFQVPGWYLLLGLLLLSALISGAFLLRRYLQNAYRREALREVDEILGREAGQWFFGIGLLLKNLAIEKFGRERVAAMQGGEWYDFLRSTSRADQGFTDADFERFAACHYETGSPDRAIGEKLGDFARHWIRTHHAGRI